MLGGVPTTFEEIRAKLTWDMSGPSEYSGNDRLPGGLCLQKGRAGKTNMPRGQFILGEVFPAALLPSEQPLEAAPVKRMGDPSLRPRATVTLKVLTL